MVNKEKALERELTRLRKSQNATQVDFRRIRKLRKARTEYWKLKKKPTITVREAPKVEKEKRKSRRERRLEKKKEEPHPELEVIEEEEDEVGLTEKADELDDLYSYDEEIEEEEE